MELIGEMCVMQCTEEALCPDFQVDTIKTVLCNWQQAITI